MGEPSDREFQQLLALDGAAGPAQPIDPARAASIVATALRSAGFPPPGAGGSGGGPHAAGRATLPKLTLLAGGAAAVVVAWLVVRAPYRSMSDPPAQLASSQPATAPPASAQDASAQREPAPDPPAPDPSTPEPSAPAQATPGEPPRRHKPLRSPAPAKLRATPAPAHHRRLPPRTAAVAAITDPEDLLAEANAARLARDWRGADALYARVASAGGAALAAQTALVASAQLHLEHLGDPDGAARRFRGAVAAGAHGTLAEEARWGLAEVARATRDAAAERSALDDFLAHHAGSVRAAQARTRRAELEAAP